MVTAADVPAVGFQESMSSVRSTLQRDCLSRGMFGSEEQDATEYCSNQKIFDEKTQATNSEATKGGGEMEIGT